MEKVNITNACSSCSKQDVCKLRDAYEAKFAELKKLDDESFKAFLECGHYTHDELVLIDPIWDKWVLKKSPTFKEQYIYTSPCVRCPNKPNNQTVPYVGDSPCQWCIHNPWKLTCKM